MRWFQAATRRNFDPLPEDVVLARKLGGGARPLSVMGLLERLVYRAAVSVITDDLQAFPRTHEAYEAFQRAPLEVDKCKYVLKADISAYYQYVDHERLVDEVVAQTGEDLAITTAVEVLRAATGRQFGLPQLSLVSDALAEVYIEPIRRRLTRAGFRVWRFADDFRVACTSYEEALEAWELTDRAARELGLVLNEAKTRTPGRDRYEASLTAVADREAELFAGLGVEPFDPFDLSEYEQSEDGEEDTGQELWPGTDFDEGEVTEGNGREHQPEVSESQLEAARQVLRLWMDEDEDADVQQQEAAKVTAVLLRKALRVFARASDTTALDAVTSILVYEPSLAPYVAAYLRSCADTDRTETLKALDDVCSSRIASAWQAVWIAFVAGDVPRRQGGATRPHVTWLKQQLNSEHPAVAAEAALALARRRFVRPSDLDDLLRRISAVHRPTVVVALGALGDEAAAAAAGNSHLDRLRVAWALEELA